MPQVFTSRANTLVRGGIAAVVLLLGASVGALYAVWWSPYMTRVNVPISQVVPFSHEHHVGGLGIDCRYCHTSVETAPSAGMPSTETCMTCHSQVWNQAPVLAPIRQSFTSGTPVQWNRVNDLPDFVYFDHSVHVQRGVACVTCHGRVDRMPLMWKVHSQYMQWCLDCHRDPANTLGPREEVFNLAWRPSVDQADRGAERMEQYHIDSRQLITCSVCHH
jgi:hypothetical protein